MKRLFDGYALYLWILVALLPVMLLRDFTPANELRYLSIADEAIRNGSLFAFSNHGLAYADKPPLYFWIIMVGRILFGHNSMLFLSLFSLIPAFVIAEVMDRWAAPQLRNDFNAEAKLLLLTCGLFPGVMVFLRMDMLMTMWIVISLYTFYRIYEHLQAGIPVPAKDLWMFPVWLFLGIFTKGPMGLLVPLVSVTVFLWQRSRLCYMKTVFGWRTWTLLLTLCLVWFGCVYAEGGSEYLDNLLFHQTVDRAVDAFHHKRPFHYYLVSMTYTFLPWTFLVFGAAFAVISRRYRWKSDIERFFLLSGVSTIVMLSFISSKIQIYMLPAYPFFVYYAATVISRNRDSRLAAAAVGLPAVALCVAGCSLWFEAETADFEGAEMLSHPIVVTAGLLLAMAVIIGQWLMMRRHDVAYGIRGVAVGLFLAVFTAGLAVGQFNSRIGYRGMCEVAEALKEESGAKGFIVYDINRPENMDVFIGVAPRVIEKGATSPSDSIPPGKWILMTSVNMGEAFKPLMMKRSGSHIVMLVDGREKQKEEKLIGKGGEVSSESEQKQLVNK